MACIISIVDLNRRSLTDLYRLQHDLQAALAVTPQGSETWAQTVTNLSTVRKVIWRRQYAPSPRF